MAHLHDRAIAEKPWAPLPPKNYETAAEAPSSPYPYTRDDPYYEAGASWWVEGESPNQRAICNDVESCNSEWPDPIYDLMKSRDPNLK